MSTALSFGLTFKPGSNMTRTETEGYSNLSVNGRG